MITTIAREWTRIGVIGFGGPPAHITLLRELCVGRRGWLSEREFEDAIAATNLLPGPASTQLAIFCAWRVGGAAGAVAGGLGFIAPGLVAIVALAALFLADSPPAWVLGAGAGAGAAVAAVAVRAGTDLLRRGMAPQYVLAGFAAAALAGPWVVLVLLAAGAFELARRTVLAVVALPALALGGGGLAWVAFKVGALSYGGGFVIVPLMQADAVDRYGWMSDGQFLNAVALGQVTPGPVVHTVAAVGFAAAGVAGALLAAAIAFVPSFVFILAGASRFDRLRADPRVRAFLDGAGPAAVGAILGAAIPLDARAGGDVAVRGARRGGRRAGGAAARRRADAARSRRGGGGDRRMRIGVQLPEVERAPTWAEQAAIALAAERGGFDSIWVGDHLLYRDPDRGPLEAWTQLAALAAITERVTLGPLVACLAFHPPLVLAKMAATVDDISGGRLVFGVGAGWNDDEFRAAGLPTQRKVTRFEEAFTTVRRLLAGERTGEAFLAPSPAHRVPLMSGSTGPRALSIVLPHVDSWNTWWEDYGNTPEGFAVLNARIDAACVSAGRDPAQVERSACVLVTLDGGAGERTTDVPAVDHERLADHLTALAQAGADEAILVLDPITQVSVERLSRLLFDAR